MVSECSGKKVLNFETGGGDVAEENIVEKVVDDAPKTKKKRKKKKKLNKALKDAPTETAVEDDKKEAEEKKAENVEENFKEETKKKEKKGKKKRSFRLHDYNPESGRAPRGGGYYLSASPQAAALKAANRWIVPKDNFETVHEFLMRETTKSAKEKKIYAFKAMRVKLDPPKTYTRGEKEIVVNSKIVIV